MLLEDRTNAILSPTHHQKAVLSKIKGAPTPQVAASEISKTQQLMTARDMLQRLGMIIVDDNKAEVTPDGDELMRNQNLADESGALTPEGENYAHAGTTPPPQPQKAPQKESLIQSLNRQTRLAENRQDSMNYLKKLQTSTDEDIISHAGGMMDDELADYVERTRTRLEIEQAERRGRRTGTMPVGR